MANLLHVSQSPHIHGRKTTQSIMLDVIIALIPASLAGCFIFGLRSLLVILTCTLSAVIAEAIFNLILKRKQTISDLSAAVTGLLIALNLSANAPLWQGAVGSVFAIIIVKCVFGGLGCNLVNPAITARVFMLIAFGSMTASAFPKEADAVTSATPLVVLSEGGEVSLFELFLGISGGTIGETCAAALILGGIYLLIRRVISWHIPVSFIATVFLFSLIYEKGNIENALAWVLSGGLIIAAFFMATDYVTSPDTDSGKLVFGIGAGLFTVLIRFFGTYPEGVSFAVLFMNILTPYIDNICKRKIFGLEKTKA